MTMQQVDPLRECKDAKDRVDQLRRELAGYGEFFAVLANALRRDPIRLMLSNTDFSAPAEIALASNVPSLNCDQWPDLPRVAVKLKAYFDAQFAYRNAFGQLPASDRTMFPNPSGRN